MLERKNCVQDVKYDFEKEGVKFITFMPGVTESLFYFSLLAVVKPYLVSENIYPNFMLVIIGPSGHLKTTLARLYGIWLQREEEQEMLFVDVARQKKLQEKLERLKGLNLIVDDMHEMASSYQKAKQVEVLDYLSRHCDSRRNLGNIIVTGERIPQDTIFSSRDRMFRIDIPNKSSEELKGLKKRINELPEKFMACLTERFSNELENHSEEVKKDIRLFYENYTELVECAETTRVNAHVQSLQLVELLYRKYICGDDERLSMKKQFEESLKKQAIKMCKQLLNQKNQEKVVDYVEVVYMILSSGNVYIRQDGAEIPYTPAADNYTLVNGKFYVTRTALQKGLLLYLKRTVSMKQVIDALYDAGVLEKDVDARTKKYCGVRHYVISREAIVLYCRVKNSLERE